MDSMKSWSQHSQNWLMIQEYIFLIENIKFFLKYNLNLNYNLNITSPSLMSKLYYFECLDDVLVWGGNHPHCQNYQ